MQPNRFARLAVAAVAAVLVAAACAESEDPEAAPETPPERELKAVLIVNQQPGDRGPMDAHIEGLERGGEEFGYETEHVYVEDPADFEPTIRQFAQQGWDLIIPTFPPQTEATINVANEFPDLKFVNTNGAPVEPEDVPPNMQIVFGEDHQGTFLGGALAAEMSETGKIGFISGPVVDIIERWEAGWIQGALHVNPDINACDAAADSYENPAQGKELAQRLFRSDVDVIGTAGALTSLGIHEAAEESDGDWHTVQLDGGDIAEVAPENGLASISTRNDNWVHLAMEQVATDRFEDGIVFLGLEEGAWSITSWGDTVPEPVRAEIEELAELVASGEITVEDQSALPSLKEQAPCRG